MREADWNDEAGKPGLPSERARDQTRLRLRKGWARWSKVSAESIIARALCETDTILFGPAGELTSLSPVMSSILRILILGMTRRVDDRQSPILAAILLTIWEGRRKMGQRGGLKELWQESIDLLLGEVTHPGSNSVGSHLLVLGEEPARALLRLGLSVREEH